MTKRASWIYVVGAIILAFGLYLVVPDRSICNPESTVERLEQKCEISYQGVEGQNALDLLKSSHETGTETSSFGEFVHTIDGVKAPSTHFWAFYVNGQQAEVGAGSYQTKNSDTITWKLEKITFTQ